jgi:DNA repair protein RecO (recombination protein O)
LVNELALLSESRDHARPANGLAFRLKLLLAAGIVPQLGACASCGAREPLDGFSPAAGGIVCSSCQSSAFPLEEEAYRFMVAALGAPLAEAPNASARALRQAERAIAEQAEHHAHVRLRPLRPSTASEGAMSSSRNVSSSSRSAPIAQAAVRIDGDG